MTEDNGLTDTSVHRAVWGTLSDAFTCDRVVLLRIPKHSRHVVRRLRFWMSLQRPGTHQQLEVMCFCNFGMGSPRRRCMWSMSNKPLMGLTRQFSISAEKCCEVQDWGHGLQHTLKHQLQKEALLMFLLSPNDGLWQSIPVNLCLDMGWPKLILCTRRSIMSMIRR